MAHDYISMVNILVFAIVYAISSFKRMFSSTK